MKKVFYLLACLLPIWGCAQSNDSLILTFSVEKIIIDGGDISFFKENYKSFIERRLGEFEEDIQIATFSHAQKADALTFKVTFSKPLLTLPAIFLPAILKDYVMISESNSTDIRDYLISAIIPSSVTEIGPYAFFGCTSLTSVTIPDSVTEIGRGAFGGCTSLKWVRILNPSVEIGESAFPERWGGHN